MNPEDDFTYTVDNLIHRNITMDTGHVISVSVGDYPFLSLDKPEVYIQFPITGEDALPTELMSRARQIAEDYLPILYVLLRAEMIIHYQWVFEHQEKRPEYLPLETLQTIRDEIEMLAPEWPLCEKALPIIEQEVEWRELYEFAKALPDKHRKSLGLKLRDITKEETRPEAITRFRAIRAEYAAAVSSVSTRVK